MSDVDLTGLTEKRNRRGTRYYEDGDSEIVAKECRGGCGEVKGLSEYTRQKKGLGERTSSCRECEREWRVKNRDKLVKTSREWRQNNKERIKKTNRQYYEANRELILEKGKEWYQANRENRIVTLKKYRENNLDRERENWRVWYKNNREYKEGYQRMWRELNREKVALTALRRRARINSLPDTLTEDQWEPTLEKFSGGCALTGDAENIHRDHIIPISTGHGGTVHGNMIPLRGDLNYAKNDRCIFDWFSNNRDRFGLSQQKFDELIEYLAEINEMTTKEYRDFVYWCHDNPRTVEEIEADNERYGYMKPSSEIWREEVANKGRELVEA